MSSGVELKGEGMGRALSDQKIWATNFLRFLRGYANMNMEFTLEDVRLEWRRLDGPAPRHVNSYGAICNGAVKKGFIVRTGEYQRAKDPRGHAREMPVWIGVDSP